MRRGVSGAWLRYEPCSNARCCAKSPVVAPQILRRCSALDLRRKNRRRYGSADKDFQAIDGQRRLLGLPKKAHAGWRFCCSSVLGDPFSRDKDRRAWSIPKGGIDALNNPSRSRSSLPVSAQRLDSSAGSSASPAGAEQKRVITWPEWPF